MERTENVFRKTSATCWTTTLSLLVNARTLRRCKIQEQLFFTLILSGKNISFQNLVAYTLHNSSMYKQFMSFLTFRNFRGITTLMERKRTVSHFISVLQGNNVFFGAGGWVVGDATRHFFKFYLQEQPFILFSYFFLDTADCQKLSHHQHFQQYKAKFASTLLFQYYIPVSVNASVNQRENNCE